MEAGLVEPPSFQSFLDSDPNNARRQLTPLLKDEGIGNADSGQGSNENPLHPNRQSQVVRKVNSGFEILRPGTLTNPEVPSNAADPTGSDRQQFKKLQKRNRAQSGSERVSQFIEQV